MHGSRIAGQLRGSLRGFICWSSLQRQPWMMLAPHDWLVISPANRGCALNTSLSGCVHTEALLSHVLAGSRLSILSTLQN